MKKNRMMRLASILLVAVLLSTSVISGTFAKYTSEATLSDKARVAKWSIDFNGKDVEGNTFVFDLFNTVYDTDGTAETDVKNRTQDGMTVVAPGTQGDFTITLVNLSEVTAKYTVEFEEKQGGDLPIKYSLNKTNWVDDISDLNRTGENAQDLPMNKAEGTSVTVYWQWVYEVVNEGVVDAQNDKADTALGSKTSLDVVEIQAKVVATQVN